MGPVTVGQWREWLRAYSAEFLDSAFLRRMADDDRAEQFCTPAQRAARWFGVEPASEDTLAATERRLGRPLPPSYRNFLAVSDGWPTISYDVHLLPTAEIGWFREVEADLLAAWTSPDLPFPELVALLGRVLLISLDDGGAGHYLLLDPDDVDADGEWAAYDWWPGDGMDPTRHDTFATMVTDLRDEELENA